MMIRKSTTQTLLGGAALSLALAISPLHAAETATDATGEPVVDGVANGTAMTAEEVEMAAEKAGEELEDAGEAVAEGAEAMGEKVEEGAEEAAAVVADALDDDEVAAKLQQDIALHPTLGAYGLEVTEIDGRYSVTGMVDQSDDFSALQQMLADVEGVDPAMIDNNVVLN